MYSIPFILTPLGSVASLLSRVFPIELWDSMSAYVHPGIACLASQASDWLERQSAALFLPPEIHSKQMLYVASSKLHLLTLLLVFFPLKKCARYLWSFLTMTSVPCR